MILYIISRLLGIWRSNIGRLCHKSPQKTASFEPFRTSLREEFCDPYGGPLFYPIYLNCHYNDNILSSRYHHNYPRFSTLERRLLSSAALASTSSVPLLTDGTTDRQLSLSNRELSPSRFEISLCNVASCCRASSSFPLASSIFAASAANSSVSALIRLSASSSCSCKSSLEGLHPASTVRVMQRKLLASHAIPVPIEVQRVPRISASDGRRASGARGRTVGKVGAATRQALWQVC